MSPLGQRGATPRQTSPRPVSGGPRLWTAARGAEDARRHAPARAPSRAPGSSGRATTSPLELLTPRPAAEQPGRLRPRAAWAGWASAASPQRLPRPRLDTTAARPGGPASPGPHPQAERGSAFPGLWGAPAPGGSAVPLRHRAARPVETAGSGMVLAAPAPSAAGGPLWGNGARRASERAGGGAA